MVLFTLLLVTGNTMAIAVRERVRELAVLKAIGYSDVSLMLLVLAESLVIAALGGGAGLVLAKLFTLRGDPQGVCCRSSICSKMRYCSALLSAWSSVPSLH